MAGTFAPLSSFSADPALAMVAAAAIAFPFAAPAQGRADKIADVAEAVIDAVVNISTSQTVAAGGARRAGDPGGARRRGGRSSHPARRSRSSSRSSSRTAAARATRRAANVRRAGSTRSAPAS